MNIVPKYCGGCWWSTESYLRHCPLLELIPPCTASIELDEIVQAAQRPFQILVMPASSDFAAKLEAIRLAMENEEWAKAIHDLETIGEIPDKFYAIASNVLFYLYISRNQHEKLARLSSGFDPAKSKDSVSALLLLRDRELGYDVTLPKNWSVEEWGERPRKAPCRR